MTNPVDSWRFVDFVTRKVLKAWAANEPSREVPWTVLGKPLEDCTVALISSGGIALKTDIPFDQEGERKDPWRGDPSYRIIPRAATAEDVEIYHLHIDPSFAREDLNCVFPLKRLDELEADGEIGRSSPRHYSFMGYTTDPTILIEETTKLIIKDLQADEADVVLLVPT
jgi:hypothetical protein